MKGVAYPRVVILNKDEVKPLLQNISVLKLVSPTKCIEKKLRVKGAWG